MASKTPRSTVKTIVGRKQSFLHENKLYIVLGSIGLVGLISLSAIAASLLKNSLLLDVAATESVTVESQAELKAATTESQVAETPSQSAYTQFLSEAAVRAESAENITRSAFSPSDWELIVARWQGAIYIIDQIPEGDPLYNEAQEKKAEYLLALSYAQQGKAVPDAPAIFAAAVNAATEASQLTQSARSPENWENVAQKWQEASALMAQMPSFAPNYQTAQAKANEYAQNRNYAQAQVDKPATPTPAVAVAGASSSSTSSVGSASSSSGSGTGGASSASTTDTSAGSNCHYVNSYTRSNGTRVRGHYRCR